MVSILLLYTLLLVGIFQAARTCEPITVEDYENYAKQRLSLGSLEYLQRGADKDFTTRRNCEAFSKVKVIPRYLQDVSNRSTNAEAMGKWYKLPVGIAPSGLQKRWHPDGELATIRAANTANTIMIVSIASSVRLEDIAKEAPDAEKWLQIFLFENNTITLDFVKQAEYLRFGAIVVTIDMTVPPLRYFNKKNMWKDQHKMVNYDRYIDDDGKQTQFKFHHATWIQLQELTNSTSLPVIVKGVLTIEDAVLSCKHGAKGIIISNHGGRQVDGTISSIEALSDIVSELRLLDVKEFEIYLDGGIRSGLDVFRALAIGAKFVFVGRAPMYGLFHSGQQGVENVLEVIRQELETLLGQTGCNSIKEIGTRHVRSRTVQVPLDLIFSEGDEISFRSVGYLVDEQDYSNLDDDEEEVPQLVAGPSQQKRKHQVALEQESASENENSAESQGEDGSDDDDDDEVDDDSEDEEDDSEDETAEPPPKVAKANGVPNGVSKKGDKHKETKQKKQQKQQQQQPQTTEKSVKILQGGLKIEDIRAGQGAIAKAGKKVQVYYEGRFKTNNKVFDKTNSGKGFEFVLGRGEVIQGWDLGVQGMRAGGKRRITCPPSMAYGSKGSHPAIPPNSTLVFDVELRGVVN